MYAYSVPLLHGANEASQHHGVTTHYVGCYTITLSRRYEQIKADLVRGTRALPNPATFAFETDLELPRIETYLPLAKQLVLGHIRRSAA